MQDPVENRGSGQDGSAPEWASDVTARLMRVLDATHAAFEAALAEREAAKPAARAARHYARRTRSALN
jgi:hypothetical protein